MGLSGIDKGSVWIYILVDGSEVIGKEIKIGEPPLTPTPTPTPSSGGTSDSRRDYSYFNPDLYPDSYPVPEELNYTKRSGISDKSVENRNIVFIYEEDLNLESLNPEAPKGDKVTKLCRYFNNFGGGDKVNEILLTDDSSIGFTPEMFVENGVTDFLPNSISADGGGYSVLSNIDNNMGMYFAHNSSGLIGYDLGSYRVLFINYPVIYLNIVENESHSIINSGTNLNRRVPVTFRIGNNLAEAFESSSEDLPDVSLKFIYPEKIISSEFGNINYSEVPLMKLYTYTDQISGIGKSVLDNVSSGDYSVKALWSDDSVFSGLTLNSNEISYRIPNSTVAWKVSEKYMTKFSSSHYFHFEGKPLTKYYAYVKKSGNLTADSYPEISDNCNSQFINRSYAAWIEMAANNKISNEIGNVAGTGAIVTTDDTGAANLCYMNLEDTSEQWFTFIVAERESPIIDRDEVRIALIINSNILSSYDNCRYDDKKGIFYMEGITSVFAGDIMNYKIFNVYPYFIGSKVLKSGKFQVISGQHNNHWNFSTEVELEYDRSYWVAFGNKNYSNSYFGVNSFILTESPSPTPLPTPQPGSSARVILPSGNMTKGGEYVLPVFLENVAEGKGVNMEIKWDSSAISLNGISVNEYAPSGTTLTSNFNGNSVNIAVVSTEEVSITNARQIIDLSVNVTGSVGDKVLISGHNCEYSRKDFSPESMGCLDGSLGIIELKGDFNGNKIIDIGDVSKVAYMVVGKEPSDPNGDFNFNGRTDIGDASKIAYYFVNGVGTL